MITEQLSKEVDYQVGYVMPNGGFYVRNYYTSLEEASSDYKLYKTAEPGKPWEIRTFTEIVTKILVDSTAEVVEEGVRYGIYSKKRKSWIVPYADYIEDATDDKLSSAYLYSKRANAEHLFEEFKKRFGLSGEDYEVVEVKEKATYEYSLI